MLVFGCAGVAKFGSDTGDTSLVSTAPSSVSTSTAPAGGGASGTGGSTSGDTGTPGTGGTSTTGGTGSTTSGTATGGGTGLADSDGDGVADVDDCAPDDPSIFPGAEERCDGEDQDCDGELEPEGVCPCPLLREAGVVWLTCEEESTWADAEATCVSVGFHLAWVNNSDQNETVRDVADDTVGRGNIWLGLNDRDVEDDFVWSSGAPYDWDNWDWGEPNNFGGEDCTEMTRGGSWNDVACGGPRPFLCRMP